MPTEPYTITAAFLGLCPYYNSEFGLVLLDSLTGRIETLGRTDYGTYVRRFTAPSALSGSPALYGTPAHTPGVIWMRLRDDGAGTRTWSLSFDGQHFTTVYSTAANDWVTSPDTVGFFVSANNSALPGAATLLSWEETA